jgi:hypothetical protein
MNPNSERKKFRMESEKINRPPFQSRQEVVICAPLHKVWEFNQDLTKIAEYHPRVIKIELVSGTSRRKAGAAYKCCMKDGKNTCIERDIEIVPMEKIVTILPEDTMGLCKIFPDYIVETLFTPLGENSTKTEFCHYYSTNSSTAKMVNLVAKPRLAKESQETLVAIKNKIEQGDT